MIKASRRLESPRLAGAIYISDQTMLVTMTRMSVVAVIYVGIGLPDISTWAVVTSVASLRIPIRRIVPTAGLVTVRTHS